MIIEDLCKKSLYDVRMPQIVPPPETDTNDTLSTPRLPTVVAGNFKGGVQKTSIAAALAERFALAGLPVLALMTDKQRCLRRRLGVPEANMSVVVRVHRGTGSITVMGVEPSSVGSLLYSDAADFTEFRAPYRVIVVDMPPIEEAGALPGVELIVPIDGTDGKAGFLKLLRSTPANTNVLLLKVARGRDGDPTWKKDAKKLEDEAGRSLDWWPDPLPNVEAVKKAHDADPVRSIWELDRSGGVREITRAIDWIAGHFWKSWELGEEMPPLPSVAKVVGLGSYWSES